MLRPEMKTPILIPAKGKSIRCPKKNEALLAYVSAWLTEEEKQRVVVISDSAEILWLAKSYGLRGWECSVTHCELTAMARYAQAHKGLEDIIYLPLTQPLREQGLIRKIDALKSNKAFIVSTSPYKDRILFKVNKDGFAAPSKERKGRYCPIYSHVDGAIYKIKADFLIKAAQSENTNAAFWGAEFDMIENNMPFLDIDTPEDLA